MKKSLYSKLVVVGLVVWGAMCPVAAVAAEEVVFTKATDLYYGTAYSTKYNHQLWFTTEGLNYDAKTSQIEGTDGMVMRLDLFCPSATNIAGTYEIVGPNYADANYKINKKYTYWTYFEEGAFGEKKLTVGTCTIVCTSKSTYTITYDVQEIDGGDKHKGTISNITIKAVKSSDNSDYKLVPTCTNEPTGLEENENDNENDNHNRARKIIKDGQLYIIIDDKRYDATGFTID